jgi:SnoaL-like domain
MSQANVGLVRAVVIAIGDCDHRVAAALFTPGAEWHNTSVSPGPQVCVGPDAIVSLWETFRDDFDVAGIEIEQIADVDGHIVAGFHQWGTGRLSGAPFDERFAAIFKWWISGSSASISTAPIRRPSMLWRCGSSRRSGSSALKADRATSNPESEVAGYRLPPSRRRMERRVRRDTRAFTGSSARASPTAQLRRFSDDTARGASPFPTRPLRSPRSWCGRVPASPASVPFAHAGAWRLA